MVPGVDREGLAQVCIARGGFAERCDVPGGRHEAVGRPARQARYQGSVQQRRIDDANVLHSQRLGHGTSARSLRALWRDVGRRRRRRIGGVGSTMVAEQVQQLDQFGSGRQAAHSRLDRGGHEVGRNVAVLESHCMAKLVQQHGEHVEPAVGRAAGLGHEDVRIGGRQELVVGLRRCIKEPAVTRRVQVENDLCTAGQAERLASNTLRQRHAERRHRIHDAQQLPEDVRIGRGRRACHLRGGARRRTGVGDDPGQGHGLAACGDGERNAVRSRLAGLVLPDGRIAGNGRDATELRGRHDLDARGDGGPIRIRHIVRTGRGIEDVAQGAKCRVHHVESRDGPVGCGGSHSLHDVGDGGPRLLGIADVDRVDVKVEGVARRLRNDRLKHGWLQVDVEMRLMVRGVAVVDSEGREDDRNVAVLVLGGTADQNLRDDAASDRSIAKQCGSNEVGAGGVHLPGRSSPTAGNRQLVAGIAARDRIDGQEILDRTKLIVDSERRSSRRHADDGRLHGRCTPRNRIRRKVHRHRRVKALITRRGEMGVRIERRALLVFADIPADPEVERHAHIMGAVEERRRSVIGIDSAIEQARLARERVGDAGGRLSDHQIEHPTGAVAFDARRCVSQL